MKVYTPTGLRDKIKLWALRAIFECDGVYDLVIRNDDVRELFRIPCDLEKKDAPKVSKMLKDELRHLEELNEAGKIGSITGHTARSLWHDRYDRNAYFRA